MSSATPWTGEADKLSLASIRSALIRQEDTIIYALIERAQFAHNQACYNGNEPAYAALTGTGGKGSSSLLDYMLLETERLHAHVRRYTSPDEHAFFPHRLPAPVLPLIEFPPVLHPTMTNLNGDIMALYLEKVLPRLCNSGDDGNHGSCVVADIAVLQAMSKRVHYGFFVAESKFRAQPAEYTKLIEARDEDAIMTLLTNAAVEEKVLQRVRVKAATFGQELDAPGAAVAGSGSSSSSSPRVDPELIVQLYRDHVIPLTKVAEVEYLLQRTQPPAVAHHGPPGSPCMRAASQYALSQAPAGKAPPKLLSCSTAADVFELVMSSKAHRGVILLEQGDGGILSAVRSLLKENPLHVVGEQSHETHFKLVARATSLDGVRRVVGRPEALRLCRSWLRQLLPRSVEIEEIAIAPGKLPYALTQTASDGSDGSGDTAFLMETYVDAAAPLQALAFAPDDVRETARCVVVSQGQNCASGPSGHDKTLLYFSCRKEQVGTLQEALECLGKNGVNLLSIRSYEADPGEVDFIAVTAGHESDPRLQGAVAELKTKAAVVKVLGSFHVPQGPAVNVA